MFAELGVLVVIVRVQILILFPQQPEARDIVAMLKNFPNVWATFNTTERKKLLKVMFLSIYFDPTSKIKLVLAHEPFDRMLPINL